MHSAAQTKYVPGHQVAASRPLYDSVAQDGEMAGHFQYAYGVAHQIAPHAQGSAQFMKVWANLGFSRKVSARGVSQETSAKGLRAAAKFLLQGSKSASGPASPSSSTLREFNTTPDAVVRLAVARQGWARLTCAQRPVRWDLMGLSKVACCTHVGAVKTLPTIRSRGGASWWKSPPNRAGNSRRLLLRSGARPTRWRYMLSATESFVNVASAPTRNAGYRPSSPDFGA